MNTKRESLIYDWNKQDVASFNSNVELDDETLRDGLQSPSVINPSVEQKLEILHLMDELGIDIADIGFPAASEKIAGDVERLAREIVQCNLSIQAGCAARALITDVEPVVDISQRAGLPIEVHIFIGSSPIRRYAEGWDLECLLRLTQESVKFAVSNNSLVMYVVEDTTRTDPETLNRLLATAIEYGAKRVCLCDTVGHATPTGVRSLIQYIRDEIIEPTGKDIKIDWHGHSDRGLAIGNTLAAIATGADRIHGTALGIGERAGNTPMDLILVNLKLMGIIEHDLTKLKEYCNVVSKYCGVPIPTNYPVVGQDAFRTATGTHAAAIIKSIAKEEDHWLRDLVYSSIPAYILGFKQIIEIGPMSGKANVQYWFQERGLEPEPDLVSIILREAKESSTTMTDDEIYKIIRGHKNRT
ncbi:LeuA family protein [Candidatus Acetothermia bacterium]|jgi:2-isopropylmalate synthase|nr:LeuA family protein [Candidatus Acetothermia bacterium]MCI2428554.1 LeuA family protein [Candidatus Acetothermia bacterium]